MRLRIRDREIRLTILLAELRHEIDRKTSGFLCARCAQRGPVCFKLYPPMRVGFIHLAI